MADQIEKVIIVHSPIERVWRALTDHREVGAWFRVHLDRPFAPGEVSRGRITYPGYEHLPWKATIVRMDEPSFFSFTWHPYAIDPDIDYSDEPTTLVEFRLEPAPDGTRLTVKESGFGALPEHRRADALRMNEGGWATQVENIRTHVEQ